VRKDAGKLLMLILKLEIEGKKKQRIMELRKFLIESEQRWNIRRDGNK
jgi:hypothetical protein